MQKGINCHIYFKAKNVTPSSWFSSSSYSTSQHKFILTTTKPDSAAGAFIIQAGPILATVLVIRICDHWASPWPGRQLPQHPLEVNASVASVLVNLLLTEDVDLSTVI